MLDYEEQRRQQELERQKEVERRIKEQKRFRRFIIGGAGSLVGLIVILILVMNAFTLIKPGHGGVKYSMFAGLNPDPIANGTYWHAPWTKVKQYPTSTEIKKHLIEEKADNSISVNTGDGKSVKVAYTYNYSMQLEKLPHIFTKYRRKPAPQIADENIDQQFINSFQNIATKHSVLEVYSQKRAEINKEVFEKVRDDLAKDGIIIEEFTIVDVVPDDATLAVLQQIADEQNKRELVIRQRNTLKEEEKNIEQQNINNKALQQGKKQVAEIASQQIAQSLEIEAEGQAKANRELQGSITQPLIEMRKLDVQLELAKNPNLPKVFSSGGGGGSILNIPESFLNEAPVKR